LYGLAVAELQTIISSEDHHVGTLQFTYICWHSEQEKLCIATQDQVEGTAN